MHDKKLSSEVLSRGNCVFPRAPFSGDILFWYNTEKGETMRNLFAFVLIAVAASFGCEQKEEPRPQYQFPSGPIQAQDESKILREILQKEPGNLNAWIKLGNMLMDTQRYAEAVDAYGKALELDPKNVDVRVDMGTCLRNSGRSDKAVEEYRKAISFNPNHANSRRNLGVVLAYDLGQKAEAVKELEKYLEIMPNAPDTAEIRSLIASLKTGQ